MNAHTTVKAQKGKEGTDVPFYVPQGDEMELFELAHSNSLPLMLKGPTGCGKTRFVSHMAAKLGRLLAVGFGLWGIFGSNPVLVLVAVFVYFAAGRELAMATREPTIDPRVSHPNPFQSTGPHTVTEVVLDPWGRPVRRVVVVRPR